jgi:hypothetical protein
MADDVIRREWVYEFDPGNPDADPETGMREVPRGEVLSFPKSPVGLEREGWDIPPEAA